MNPRPTFLCPVDFSEASRGALRYATVLAERFDARLVVITIDDPMLSEVSAHGNGHGMGAARDTVADLDRFVTEALERAHSVAELEFVVVTGKPAAEILRISQEQKCDLLIMGSHGVTGASRLFFGSTTERVLRETSVPVLVTPASDVGPDRFEDLKRIVRRVLAPVDLGGSTTEQMHVARAIAEVLTIPFLITHVVERARPSRFRTSVPNVDLERRLRAELALGQLAGTVPPYLRPEALVVYGDPAEEIAKIAQDRGVGVIVMGLHSSPLTAPRMGSVTYRVLCLTRRLVLALPPDLKAAIPYFAGRVEAPAETDVPSAVAASA